MTKKKRRSSVDPILLTVLQSALWGRPLPKGELGARRFQQLYDQATKQTCVGLYCAALLEGGVRLNPHNAAALMVTLDQLRIDNGKINSGLADLVTLLEAHRIPFLVVKGQLVGSLYPSPALRCPGDIDFYVPPTHYSEAKALIAQQWHVDFEVDEEGEQHEAFSYHEVFFEMHYSLMKFYSRLSQQRFDDMLSKAVEHPYIYKVNGLSVPSLPPVENIVYTFLHLVQHLVELGVGLRQFCDLACLLKAFPLSPRQVDGLQRRLEAVGFFAGFKAVGSVLVDCLGLPSELFPFPLTDDDRRYQTTILRVVAQGGNFGFYGRNHEVRSGIAYFVSAFFLKLRHYIVFYHLFPREIRSRLVWSLPRKVLFGLRFRHSVS